MAYPMGESKDGVLRLDFDRRLKLEFHGSKVTTDAGLLAYRELDDALGLTLMVGDELVDPRTGKNGQHAMKGLFRQSVFGRLGGYEDVNDADRLGRDPAMRWIVGGRAVAKAAASTSQMGRFETEFLATDENLTALTGLSGQWIDRVHGLHGRRRRAVGEQVELAFLDAVFHLAAGAIEIFVEAAGVDLFPAQAGHHETRIGTVGQVLGLAHNPPRSAPGGLCLVGEIPEQPSRLAGGSAQPRCLPGLGRQHRLQARVGRQAEQVSDTLGLAPRHQLLAAEARIAAQHDPHLRPAGPDAGDDRACGAWPYR